MAGTHPDAETETRDTSVENGDSDIEEAEDTSVGRWRSLLTTARESISPVIRAWMVVVRAFSWALARVVALILFVFAFIPYGLVMRIIGFDPLQRSFDQEADSYWDDAESANQDIQSFRRQY